MGSANLHSEIITALEWYVDHGVTDVLLDKVIDRTVVAELPVVPITTNNKITQKSSSAPVLLGKSDARIEAVKLAKSATTLEELQATIAEFDGIAIKKTASNMVFADGNSKADIMLIGDAPAADEDRSGKPFVGDHGELLNKILASIGLSRYEQKMAQAVYISNILNWRPPGNRSPTVAEIEVSLPFIERHIQLVNPKVLILCGSVAAKSLLGRSESISRLRKSWHDYKPQTELGGIELSIPTIVTYAPSSLLKNPLQKKSVWADMLLLREKLL